MNNDVKKGVFFVLLLMLIFVAYTYMVKPVNADIVEQKQKAQFRLEKLARLGQLAESKDATFAAKYLSEQIEILGTAITFFESKLPPKSKVHEVLEQVVLIAQKQGLKPKTIRTLKKKSHNRGYIEQSLKMGLEGDFDAFYSFLLELEKLPRIIKIRELKIKRAKQNTSDKQDGLIAADLIVSIFFQGS